MAPPSALPFLLAAALLRVYQVVRYPGTLDARVAGRIVGAFRGLALLVMTVAGFPPVGAPDARVQVRLAAHSTGSAVVLTLSVFDGTEETARFTTRFADDAELVTTADGSSRVVVDVTTASSVVRTSIGS